MWWIRTSIRGPVGKRGIPGGRRCLCTLGRWKIAREPSIIQDPDSCPTLPPIPPSPLTVIQLWRRLLQDLDRKGSGSFPQRIWTGLEPHTPENRREKEIPGVWWGQGRHVGQAVRSFFGQPFVDVHFDRKRRGAKLRDAEARSGHLEGLGGSSHDSGRLSSAMASLAGSPDGDRGSLLLDSLCSVVKAEETRLRQAHGSKTRGIG